jgi:hypothetical protein
MHLGLYKACSRLGFLVLWPAPNYKFSIENFVDDTGSTTSHTETDCFKKWFIGVCGKLEQMD